MTLSFSNGSIDAAGSSFIVKNIENTTVFETGIATSGGQNYSYNNTIGVPMFAVGTTSGAAWSALTNNAWNKINTSLTTVLINRGSYYNTSTTRFTCPISGPYLFMFSAYVYTQDGYLQPAFYVNGSSVTRRGSSYKPRARGQGITSGYPSDLQIEQVINCVAGDYVEMYVYSVLGTAANFIYPAYSHFQGVYVG